MNSDRRIFKYLGHWALAIPILLIVSGLAFSQFDLYPPARDEFFSILNAGFVIDGPYSPQEIVQSLARNAPMHMPGYFFLLSAWGNVISNDVAMLRTLGIFAGLLSLAIAYRLGKDYIDPIAGIITLILVASNHYFNYQYNYIRMYSCVVFISGLALWLYCRVTYRQDNSAMRWLALSLSVFALVMLHAISAFFFLAMLCSYHFIIEIMLQKNRRWSPILAVAFALILSSPFLAFAATVGAGITIGQITRMGYIENRPSLIPFARALLTIGTNFPFGVVQIALVALILARFVYVAAAKTRPFHWRLIMLTAFGLPALIVCGLIGLVPIERLRYSFSIFLPAILSISVGLCALTRWRPWMLGVVAIFVATSLIYYQGPHFVDHVGVVQRKSFNSAPLHAIARLARQAEHQPHLLGYQQSHDWILTHAGHRNASLEDYLFRPYDIKFEAVSELAPALQGIDTGATAAIWIFYKETRAAPDMDDLAAFMDRRDYQLCRRSRADKDTAILEYLWQTLPCDA